ncbi:MAG: DUF4157 domain-containing protein [Sphingobacteriales bacterium]|nr:MAG: DUF4157 domain-containing protein [Sphingobacteriales bacterium]
MNNEAPYLVRIKEQSWVARLAARKLGFPQVALVIGNTIHLYNTTRQEFLKSPRWLTHELKHVEQYRQNGTLPFLIKYLFESLKNGYYRNKYEMEARAAETDEHLLKEYKIV